jgi:hypothetical protein
MHAQSKTSVLAVFAVVILVLSACQPKPSSGAPGSDSSAGVSPVSLPEKRLDHAGDVDSHNNAKKKSVSGGDVFVNDLYERPFNANSMDTYFPYLDIVDVQGFKDDTWGYATITLANTDADGALSGQYAVELDTNKDGRGDWLVRADAPSGTDWSTKGVTTWKDPDDDIGASVALVAETRPQGGDGYETKVFDQGQGKSPDDAWVRINADDPRTLEIAFKLSAVGDPSGFAMGAWAGSNLDPSMFDYNDHMTHAQAGSPNPGYDTYPLKDLAEVDNTCRLAIGFSGNSGVPGLCTTAERAKEAQGGGSPPCPEGGSNFAVIPPPPGGCP